MIIFACIICVHFHFLLKIINIEILAIKNFENKLICIEHKNSKKNIPYYQKNKIFLINLHLKIGLLTQE
jgi:hypothetical protein